MKHENSFYELNILKAILLFNSLNHYISKKYLLIILILFYFTSENSEISLIIEGTGQKNFINESINLGSYEVIINNEITENSIKSYNFVNGLNNVTIKFNNKIESCQSMFQGM